MSEMAQTADHLLVIGRGRIIADAEHQRVRQRQLCPERPGPCPGTSDLADALARRGALVESAPDGCMVVTGLDAAGVGGVASAHGITLIELAPQVSSLEEAFFDLTRDETDYHAGQLTGSTKGN